MIQWMLVIYVFDYFGLLLYTSCILGWLIIKYLNKISFTYQKQKILPSLKEVFVIFPSFKQG